MSTIEQIGEIGFATVLVIIPILGMTYALSRLFVRRVITIKHQLKNKSIRPSAIIVLGLLLIFIMIGSFLSITLCIVFWFPAVDLPDVIRNTGVILLFGYWICFFILYGLSRAVSAGYGSASGLLNEFFILLSNKPVEETNKNEKT